MVQQLRSLKDLPPDESVYLGVNLDGDLLFKADLRFHSINKKREHVIERFLVALALTEVCCNKERGKVGLRPWSAHEISYNQHTRQGLLFSNA